MKTQEVQEDLGGQDDAANDENHRREEVLGEEMNRETKLERRDRKTREHQELTTRAEGNGGCPA